MKIYYPGVVMIPLVLFLIAAGSLIHPRILTLWPVTFIATGLEELYLWATTKSVR